MSSRRGLAKLPDGRVVGAVHGGNRWDGCAAVELVVVGASRMDLVKRARDTGASQARVEGTEPPEDDAVEAALADPDGIAWRFWGERRWRPSVQFRANEPPADLS